MDPSFRRVTRRDVDEHLQPVLQEMIAEQLAKRQPGHCMKIGSLSTGLMESLTATLCSSFGKQAQVHVLGSAEDAVRAPNFITSSKLIELRNPLPNGDLRPPLLVFVPDDLRVSAEDSFSGATFEQLDLSDGYNLLRQRLLEQVPSTLRSHAEGCIRFLQERGWSVADTIGSLRFLLSLKINGYEEEVLGAALCEVGLVPDFGLMEDPSTLQNRLAKNYEAAKNLLHSTKSVIGRVLDLDIANQHVVPRLVAFLATNHLEDPVAWTSLIATDERNFGISFDKWGEGVEDPYSCNIFIQVLSIDLPEVKNVDTDPRLKDLKGQQVLIIGGNGPQSLKVRFRCSPAPSTIPAIDHFKIQLISKENGPTGAVKKKKTWEGPRQETTQSFSKLGKKDMDWEEGWHFVRVLPYNEDGDILPIVNASGQPIAVIGEDEDSDAPHESDLFYVICDEGIIVDPPQRAVPRFPTLQHAITSKVFSAVAAGGAAEEPMPAKVSWQAAEVGRDQSEMVEFKFPGEGSVNIPLTRPLRKLQQAMLAAPEKIARWGLSLHHSTEAEITCNSYEPPASEALIAFKVAREKAFQKIRGAEGDGIVELVGYSGMEAEVLLLAETYSDLVASAIRGVETAAPDEVKAALEALNGVLAIDSAAVRLTDFRGGRRTAYLASPTHPLRLLWLVCWARLGKTWADQLTHGKANMAASVKQSLFDSLALINFPACLTGADGRILQCNDNIHPLWTVYSSSDEPDPRGLLAEICTALGLPETSVGGFSLNGDFLASRIRRYVTQHPYVQTLSLNCFNVGRGRVVADALLALQRFRDTCGLRYDVRIFAENPEAPGCGEDLAELISPLSSQAAAEADAFATPTGDHLSPKLTFAQRAISEFQASPGAFPAHITLLFDIFPSQSIGARAPDSSRETAPIHGLLQDFSIIYEEEQDRVAWHKLPRHGKAVPMPEAGELSDLLSGMSTLMSTAAATVATGQAGSVLRPVSTLVLEAKQKALLHQVHEASDWVFTIDRSMGVEFFDHKPSDDRPEYLIDHSPDFSSNSGRRVVITSRSHTEIRMLFEAVLKEHGLHHLLSRAASLLGELRVLSGRLALKLVSATTQRAEALGLALGKLFLEYQNAFQYQALVPLDSHTDLLRAGQAASADLSEEVSLKRTDLALFDFDWRRRLLTCRLVEVKCYKNAGGSLDGLNSLKRSISEQLDGSEQAIRKCFNLELAPDAQRPDRVIRTQQFRSLLEFYVERAYRLGLMSPDALSEAAVFLNAMEAGYEIAFTKSALIFDFEKEGFEESLAEDGVQFHRIGRDLISGLIEALPSSDAGAETIPFSELASPSEPRGRTRQCGTIEELRSRSFPRIASAAFLPQERDHTVEPEVDEPPPRSTRAPSAEAPASQVEPRPPETTLPKIDPASQVEPPIVRSPAEAASGDQLDVIPAPKVSLPDVVSIGPLANGAPAEAVDTRPPDVWLGSSSESPQYGHLAKVHGRSIALDLNQTQTISLFGVQGGGKSYTLGTIIEMATMPIPGVNLLPQPLATVVFHYSQTQDYKPEFTSLNRPNDDKASLASLLEDYGASGKALDDIVLLTPEGKLEARRAEYPEIEVLPLKFSSAELQAGHWRFLMGAVGNQATYIRRLNQIMRSMRDEITLASLRTAVENAGFTDGLKDLALMRLDLAATYIDDQSRVSDLLRPGRLVIVDLRDEFIEKDEALGLFVVLLQLFSDATDNGRFFNKLVVFDEAHKYIESANLVDGLIGVVREMRHKGTSILVASQDPPSVPVSLIELSTQIILHRFNSPAWLKHIQKANAALSGLQSDHLSRLKPGEAFVWSAKSTDRAFSTEAVKVTCRPRVTRHGGDTKTAVL